MEKSIEMKIATIDLGTNSVRFDIHSLSNTRKPKRLHREKLMVRLGQGVFTEGRLDPEAVRRTLEAFRSFKRTCIELKVDRVVAFATSALREAQDGIRLVNLIRLKTGIEIRVISGQEEASLIAKGILQNERKLKGLFAIVDVGGGSTEVIVCRNRKVVSAFSFELGTARLQQVFLKRSPPKSSGNGKKSPIDALRAHIRDVIEPIKQQERWPTIPKIIGASGTARALARIVHKGALKKGQTGFNRQELSQVVNQMSTMTTSQLLNLSGMEPKRVDMILAGALLLEEIMKILKTKKLLCTEFSLRDGILGAESEALRSALQQSHLKTHMPAILKLSRKLGCTESHVRQVTEMSEKLFLSLNKTMRLNESWLDFLIAAGALHDCGKSINSAQHERHSYYIIKNADLPMLDKWEIEFLAQLCLNHKARKLVDLPFQKNRKMQTAFKQTLALLRVADALSQDSRGPVKILGIRNGKNQIEIKIQSTSSFEIHKLRVDQKKNLFEEVFKKPLVLTTVKSV